MPGSTLVFDKNDLDKFDKGDLGIADRIYNEDIKPESAKAITPQDKAKFDELANPNKKAGLHAMEKTAISGMLDTQKIFAELCKICLELFGGMEVASAALTGGINPENDPSSFAYAYKMNKSKMAQFKTGFETGATPDGADPVYPPALFLGKFKRSTPNVGTYNQIAPTQADLSGRFSINNDAWPKWTDFNAYQNYEVDSLNAKMVTLDQPTKAVIMNGRLGIIGQEWGEMESGNQMVKKYGNLADPNLYHSYKTMTVVYQGKEVEVSPEINYIINVDRQVSTAANNTYDQITITATLDPTKVAPPSNNQGSFGPTTPASPPSFPGGQSGLIQVWPTFAQKVLPVLIKKVLPFLVKVETEIFVDPSKHLGGILEKRLKEHYEMFDPKLKDKPKDDETRKKYWNGDDFVSKGKASIKVGVVEMTMDSKGGDPKSKTGKENIPREQMDPLLLSVMNLTALPMNFLKDVIAQFKVILLKIFAIPALPATTIEVKQLLWIKQLMLLPNLYRYLGVKGVDLTDIPMFNIPKDGNLSVVPQMIKKFIKLITMFINGFIDIVNSIANTSLGVKLPVPP